MITEATNSSSDFEISEVTIEHRAIVSMRVVGAASIPSHASTLGGPVAELGKDGMDITNAGSRGMVMPRFRRDGLLIFGRVIRKPTRFGPFR